MTSTVTMSGPSKIIKFPVVAKMKLSGVIVLFTSNSSGTVLYDNGRGYGIGYHSNDFYSVQNNNAWEILDDVTINFKS